MLAKLRSRVDESEFAKNVAKLTVGTTIAQVLLIFASPLLSRLYTPSDFGNFALYNSSVTIMVILATGRYDLGIVSASSKKEAQNLLSLSITFLFVFVSVSTSFIFLFGDWFIDTFLSNDQASDFILLIPVTVLFLGVYQIMTFWSNREKEYSTIAVSKVTQNVLNLLTALLLGIFLSWGIGLILGHIIGAIVATTYMLYRSKISYSEIYSSLHKAVILSTAKKFADFPKFLLPTAFIDTFTLQLPVFLIIMLFSESVAGHFSFAYRILSVPIALIGASMGQVFFQKLTEIHLNNQNTRKLILRMWTTLFIVGVVPFSILLLFGGVLFDFAFGYQWRDAGEIASILAIPLFFAFCSSPTSTAFIVFGMQRYSLFFGLIALVMRPLAFYIGYLYQDVMLGLILWGIFDVAQVILYNTLIWKKSANGLSQENI
jgi:lipopolysaccharide exporter